MTPKCNIIVYTFDFKNLELMFFNRTQQRYLMHYLEQQMWIFF